MSEKLERIPDAKHNCPYCGTPAHYWFCKEMTDEWQRAVNAGKPRPLPVVRW